MALQNQNDENWKRQSYIFGAGAGTLLGVLAAYLFNRAAEENAERNGGKPERISTGQLITLGLATLGIVRQISELGKPSNKKR